MQYNRYSKPGDRYDRKPFAKKPFTKKPFNKKPFKKKHFVRKKLYGTTERPRLLVFRSLKHIYGQLVDDSIKKTITTVSTHSKELREEMKGAADRVQAARIVGKTIAAKALAMNVKGVVFDRNGFVYHGRVKAFAEGAREGGLWLHSH
jgi:large subunit ribosomal protein L18